MSDPREIGSAKLQKIKEVFDDLPATYPEIEWQLAAIQHAFRSEVALHLEPHINRFLQEVLPLQKTDRERLSLSAQVDGGLANLGVCAHVNGEPALLAVEAADPSNPEKPKYSVIVRADNALGIQRTETSNEVPPLKLMAEDDNNASYMKPLRDFAYQGKVQKGQAR